MNDSFKPCYTIYLRGAYLWDLCSFPFWLAGVDVMPKKSVRTNIFTFTEVTNVTVEHFSNPLVLQCGYNGNILHQSTAATAL